MHSGAIRAGESGDRAIVANRIKGQRVGYDAREIHDTRKEDGEGR